MAFRDIDPRSIDESPLFKLLTEVVTKGPGWVLEKAAAGISIVGEAVASAGELAFDKVAGVSLGSSASKEPDGAMRVQEPIITKSPQREYEFNPAELGELAPPALPMQAASRGTGVNVG